MTRAASALPSASAPSLVLAFVFWIVGCGGAEVSPLTGAQAPPATSQTAPAASNSGVRSRPLSRAPEATDTSAPPKVLVPEGVAIGTPHPTVVAAVDPRGSWVVLCQARADTDGDGHIEVRTDARGQLTGDQMSRYLVRRSGKGEPIDELVATGPHGRWLVVRRAGQVVLEDARGGTQLDLTALGADPREDGLPSARAFSFDPTGSYLAYQRTRAGKPLVVVRRLKDGKESRIDPGSGELWRVDFDAVSKRVILRMSIDDTNGNGRLEWPVPERKGLPPCTGVVPQFAAWLDHGDRPEVKWAPITGGSAKHARGMIASLEHRLLIRDPDGSLFLQLPRGRRQRIATEKCKGRVLHVDAPRDQVLVACSAVPGRPPVHLLARGLDLDLGILVAPTSLDHVPLESPALLPLYPGRGTVLVDLPRRRITTLKYGDRVVATHGSRALIWRGTGLLIHQGGRDLSLPGKVSKLPQTFHNGAMALVSPWVVDLSVNQVLGQVSGEVLALATTGQVLIAPNTRGEHGVLRGPLLWRSPERSKTP